MNKNYSGDVGEGARTFTRQARREQFIDATLALLTEHGYAGVSLSKIAERAGVSKPTVLYHFHDKAAVVRAAYGYVLAALVEDVGAAVDAAAVPDRPAAYVRSMVRHFSEHPRHVRTIVEAFTYGEAEHDPSARWRPLAEILCAADRSRSHCANTHEDYRNAALFIGGAIDAIVLEKSRDPEFDAANAADEIVRLMDHSSRCRRPGRC